MRLSEVEITDILGTTYQRFAPGSLTIVSGSNGSGKTSIIQALLSVFEGGHDPGLLRTGAKKGTVKLTLDDGTTITRTVTARSSTVEILDAAGHVIPKPQTFVNQLAEAMRVDPGRLLLAKDKDLQAVLLEVMPVTFTAAEVEAAAGRRPPAETLDLEGLAAARKLIYEERAATNRQARDNEGTVAELRRSLPPEDEKTDWTAAAATVRSELAGVERALGDAKQETREACLKAQQDTKDRFSVRIRELERERDLSVEATRLEGQKALDEFDAEAKPMLDKLTVDLATASERAQAQQRAAGVRDSIVRFETRCKELNSAAIKLGNAIEALDGLKKQRLGSLAIPGIDFSADGKLTVDGTPWAHTNTARRVSVAFQIWDLWGAPFAVLDDAEHFDGEMWRCFQEYCTMSGRQVIAARVTDSPLTIETVEVS